MTRADPLVSRFNPLSGRWTVEVRHDGALVETWAITAPTDEDAVRRVWSEKYGVMHRHGFLPVGKWVLRSAMDRDVAMMVEVK